MFISVKKINCWMVRKNQKMLNPYKSTLPNLVKTISFLKPIKITAIKAKNIIKHIFNTCIMALLSEEIWFSSSPQLHIFQKVKWFYSENWWARAFSIWTHGGTYEAFGLLILFYKYKHLGSLWFFKKCITAYR